MVIDNKSRRLINKVHSQGTENSSVIPDYEALAIIVSMRFSQEQY